MSAELELTEAVDAFFVGEEAPAIMCEVDSLHWQGAEPDVGVMSAYVDDWQETFHVGSEFTTSDRSALANHLIERGDYEGSEGDIADAIKTAVEQYIGEVEPD